MCSEDSGAQRCRLWLGGLGSAGVWRQVPLALVTDVKRQRYMVWQLPWSWQTSHLPAAVHTGVEKRQARAGQAVCMQVAWRDCASAWYLLKSTLLMAALPQAVQQLEPSSMRTQSEAVVQLWL